MCSVAINARCTEEKEHFTIVYYVDVGWLDMLKDDFLVLRIQRYPDYKNADQRQIFCIILILIVGLMNFDPMIAFHGGPLLNTRFGNDGGDDIESWIYPWTSGKDFVA